MERGFFLSLLKHCDAGILRVILPMQLAWAGDAARFRRLEAGTTREKQFSKSFWSTPSARRHSHQWCHALVLGKSRVCVLIIANCRYII